MMPKGLLSALLDLPLISRVRRNHALEHATIQVLSERRPNLRLMGRSSLRGFIIYGNVSTDDILDATREGLQRLRAGDRVLAIHPNCGSNYVVAGTIAALSAFLALGGLSGKRRERLLDRLARLPMACTMATLGIILSRPLGTTLQAHVTTEPEVGNLHVAGVTRDERGGTAIHFVRTDG
jgi:hypothetical protein